jgi:endonuclease/exonuclease/phosphatase family metal-dependent hydrolase
LKLLLLQFLVATVASLEVSILTQNVWFILIASIPAADRIPGIIQGLRDSSYDVLCLQEVWSSTLDTTYLDSMLEGLGDIYPHTVKYLPQPLRQGRVLDSGLLIMSKYPIADFAFHAFGNSSGFDTLSDKGVMMAHLEIPVGDKKADLIIANTHLNAGGGVQYAQTVEATDALNRFLDSLKDTLDISRVPVIAAGDFNTDERDDNQTAQSEDYLRILEALGPDTKDLYRQVQGSEPLGNTFSQSRIDFVFGVSGEYTVVQADVDAFVEADPDSRLSDHLGSFAVIDIPVDLPIPVPDDNGDLLNNTNDGDNGDTSSSRRVYVVWNAVVLLSFWGGCALQIW